MNTAERGAYLYARVKATMILRTNGDFPKSSGRRLRRFKLPTSLCAAAMALTLFAGGSGAGVSAYQGTLYFAGPASSIAGWQLTTASPGAQGSAPTATAGVANSGGVPTGSYRYIYVTTSGSARTASVTTATVNVTNAPVSVTNVPVGAEVYRAKMTPTPATAYFLIGTNPGPTTTYSDTSTATSGALLPQADNRVNLATTGWAAFVPGTTLPLATSNTTVSSSQPAIPSSCTGWIVDASGGMSFPAGQWTIDAQVRPDANGNGAAALTAAVWKVNDSGSTVSGGTVVPVTDGGSFTFNNTNQTVSVTYTASSPTTLADSEHLCVQFWRHQTTGYTSGGATSRTIAMLAWDPNNKISVHPAPNALPSATLSSPADGTHTSSLPSLSATYSDAEADAGSITMRLCTDSGCTSSPQNSGALAVSNGATANWTPSGPLADGTYYWQAQAQDAGGTAAWTSSRSFVLDATAPVTSVDMPPSAQSNLASGTIGFSANESVTGFQCRVDVAAYAACSSPYAYGPLLDGPHTFDVKAVADLAGNAGAAASVAWTVDTAAPDTSIVSAPSALSNSAGPSFDLSATEPGSFECSLDGAAFAGCADPATYLGLADGAHTFQARALDAAGNADPTPASHVWTIDATAPDTSIGPTKPSSLTTATSATFDFSSTEAGSFACRLDAGSFIACTTPKAYAGLADGSHTFSVRATDTASNADPTPATYTWTVDTTAPDTAIGPGAPPANTSSTSATFDFSANEPGSMFECRLDGAAYGACTTPASYSGVPDGVHTFDVRATDAAGNLDASPASYTWSIDNVGPATPTLVAPADALATNGVPQLRASFDDTTPGDTGSVDFQLCSNAAPAGSACAPVMQASSAAGLSSGGVGTMTPAALTDGTYYWQARAQDAAGNQSAWSATRSFQLDTSAPAVTLGEPADGAWVKTVHLTATFSKASFAGTGSVEFRLCSDALCLGVLKTAQTGQVLNGGLADWTPSGLVDGLYYWQARAHDSVGNVSAWSSTRSFTRDTVAPGKPLHFNGHVDADGLTLRWESPGGTIANYVVFVDGKPWKNLGSSEFEAKAGPFDENDGRTFSVVATDPAGNIGPMSPVLVGVPRLVGLTFTDATRAASARGLELHHPALLLEANQLVVASQDPEPSTLAEQGSAIDVELVAAKGAPLVVRVKPGSLRSKSGAYVRFRIQLSAPAVVNSRLLNTRGHLVDRGRIGSLRAGTTTVRVKLPRSLRRGAYRLLVDANGGGDTARAVLRLKVTPL
jgi:hypothetical protein